MKKQPDKGLASSEAISSRLGPSPQVRVWVGLQDGRAAQATPRP